MRVILPRWFRVPARASASGAGRDGDRTFRLTHASTAPGPRPGQPEVGDLAGNADLVARRCAHGAEVGADLRRVPRDDPHRLPDRGPGAARRRSSRRRAAVQRARRGSGRRGTRRPRRRRRLPRPRAGTRDRTRSASPKSLRRTPAPCCTAGAVVARYAKHHLPNYGVFDEFRNFVPGDTICVDPGARRRRRARDLRGPLAGRRPGRRSTARPRPGCCSCQRLAVRGGQGRRAARAVRAPRRARPAAPLAYVNLVGGQDELVFDGDSLVVDADGDGAGAGRAVRAGAARRRPRPARRDRATPARRPPGPARRAPSSPPSRSRPHEPVPRRRRRSRTRPRSTARWCSGCATTSARTASTAVAARAVRRHRLGAGRRRSPCDALGAENVFGVSNPSE